MRGIALAPKKNLRKRAASSSLKDTLPSSNTFTPINKGKTAVASGRKNTQIKSKARAEVNEEMPRPETCLRYAGEYTLFPKLKCTLAPNSIANYIKKGKSCEDISINFFSLANAQLIAGEVLAILIGVLS
ncbi:uncharacterized protein RAG0_16740 [Rhynchosporium agropyri]|uniref:Uncharacterized protein n=1 Tax=Rhynchosporium agropyri TaxID=914238 RepID=A0A1E1LRS4_9HELO|nr:uncharacterized protein RAG0_16740 [Rhynchosporium agropyri]